MTIRIVLVDDTRMFRDGLSLVIGMQEDMAVVGSPGTVPRRSRWLCAKGCSIRVT